MQKPPLIAVGVVGDRHFDDVPKESNIALISDIVKYLNDQYAEGNYYIATFGCDRGFGYDLCTFCTTNKIKFVVIETFINAKRNTGYGDKVEFGTTEDYSIVFKSRHAAFMELVSTVFVKKSWRFTVLNDLVKRIKGCGMPYYIYNEQNQLLEYKGDPTAHES